MVKSVILFLYKFLSATACYLRSTCVNFTFTAVEYFGNKSCMSIVKYTCNCPCHRSDAHSGWKLPSPVFLKVTLWYLCSKICYWCNDLTGSHIKLQVQVRLICGEQQPFSTDKLLIAGSS
jgi:hypothetical protein